jgi:FkbM family methyltransferase
MLFQKITSLIAKTYIFYCQKMPNHRGRHRIAKMLDSIFGSFIAKTPKGLLLEVYLSSSMDLSFYEDEKNNSHKEIIKNIQQLKAGDTFIDIGANIGFFSLLASKFVGELGRVICYEPSPREFKRLLTNIEINKAENIMPCNLALSDYVGQSKLFIDQSHTGVNALSKDESQENNYTLVPLFTGDLALGFLKNDNSGNWLVKIDVEGAEYAVLSGMKSFLKKNNLKTPKFLKRFNHNKDGIYALMEECGFQATVHSSDWQYDEVFIR